MYASLLLGLGSHKHVTNSLLRLYYWKPVLFLVCAGSECWYLTLYSLAFTTGPLMIGVPACSLALAICTPAFLFKQAANVVQMAVACQALVEHDVKQKHRT